MNVVNSDKLVYQESSALDGKSSMADSRIYCTHVSHCVKWAQFMSVDSYLISGKARFSVCIRRDLSHELKADHFLCLSLSFLSLYRVSLYIIHALNQRFAPSVSNRLKTPSRLDDGCPLSLQCLRYLLQISPNPTTTVPAKWPHFNHHSHGPCKDSHTQRSTGVL